MTRSIARLAVVGTAAVSLAAAAAPALAGAPTTHSSSTRAVRTTLTIKAPKATTTKGPKYKATVDGTLRARHKAVAGEAIELFERKGSGKAWTDTTQSQTTDANGKVTFTFTQTSTNEQYQLRFAGDTAATPPLKKSHSGTVSIRKAKTSSTSS